MKLAVFTGQYFWFDGEHYSTNEAFVKFVTSFSPYFEKIVFCDPLRDERRTQAYILDPTEADVCGLPCFSLCSWRSMLLSLPKIYHTIRKNAFQWDVVWLHAPHPVSLMLAYVCKKLQKPFFLFVRQNLPVYVSLRSRGARKILAVSAALILDHFFRLLARKTITFTVGRELCEKYGEVSASVFEMSVSLVAEKDIFYSASGEVSNRPRPAKLLSVGRLDPEKGVIYLIRGLGELVAKGNTEVRLEVVGEGVEEAGLRREISGLGLDGYVNFRGYIAHGDQLLSMYRKADIYILTSLTEGSPQTLFEAMACGVPIVASRVGGIPYLIKDGVNGVLINPGCPREICSAVERLISDSRLRNRLVRNGLSTVKSHTMEAERDRMMTHVEEVMRLKQPTL